MGQIGTKLGQWDKLGQNPGHYWDSTGTAIGQWYKMGIKGLRSLRLLDVRFPLTNEAKSSKIMVSAKLI